METTSFFEEERRGKDIVYSGTGFVKNENLVATKKKTVGNKFHLKKKVYFC